MTNTLVRLSVGHVLVHHFPSSQTHNFPKSLTLRPRPSRISYPHNRLRHNNEEFQLFSRRLPPKAQSVPNSIPEEGKKEAPSLGEFITSERVKIVCMVGMALALCNADRVVMSVAIVPLSLLHGWSRSFSGIVQVHCNPPIFIAFFEK